MQRLEEYRVALEKMVDANDLSEQMGGSGPASNGDANKAAAVTPFHGGEQMTGRQARILSFHVGYMASML